MLEAAEAWDTRVWPSSGGDVWVSFLDLFRVGEERVSRPAWGRFIIVSQVCGRCAFSVSNW